MRRRQHGRASVCASRRYLPVPYRTLLFPLFGTHGLALGTAGILVSILVSSPLPFPNNHPHRRLILIPCQNEPPTTSATYTHLCLLGSKASIYSRIPAALNQAVGDGTDICAWGRHNTTAVAQCVCTGIRRKVLSQSGYEFGECPSLSGLGASWNGFWKGQGVGRHD